MNDRERNQRNLNSHRPARIAMLLYSREYSLQRGGVMDFWDSLSENKKKYVKELAVWVMEGKDA